MKLLLLTVSALIINIWFWIVMYKFVILKFLGDDFVTFFSTFLSFALIATTIIFIFDVYSERRKRL